MVDIKTMSFDELKMLAEDVRLEMKKREDMRLRELATGVCDAIKALKAEFPYVRFEIEVETDDCEHVDIDIMDYVSEFTPGKFY